MPTVHDLRGKSKSMGLTKIYKLRKRDLEMLIAAVCIQRARRHQLYHGQTCPITGGQITLPLKLGPAIFETSAVADYFVRHAVKANNPVTGIPLTDKELSNVLVHAKQKSSVKDVRAACAERLRRERAVQAVCFAVEDCINDLCISGQQDTAMADLAEWTQQLLAEMRCHLRQLHTFCPASALCMFDTMHQAISRTSGSETPRSIRTTVAVALVHAEMPDSLTEFMSFPSVSLETPSL